MTRECAGTRSAHSKCTTLLYRFDEYLDAAAAGEADRPCGLVADAELQRADLTVAHSGDRLLDHGAFDAAAGDGADEGAVVAHRDLAASLARRRAPGLDDGAQRDLTAF